MSGGRWNYLQSRLAEELFGSWNMGTDYGKDAHDLSAKARKLNPLDNAKASELVWDVLCLIHAKDWDVCGDTSHAFEDDWEWFQNKWFNRTTDDDIEVVKEELHNYCDKLIKDYIDT